MFGSIGGFEMLALMVIGLLVFGPRKLPEIGRTLGRAILELRKAGMEMKQSIEREIDLEDLKEAGRSVEQEVGAGVRQVREKLIPRLPDLGLTDLDSPDPDPGPGTGPDSHDETGHRKAGPEGESSAPGKADVVEKD